ncbi:hypothetical protein NHH03_21680 [Stieleria sp. TO1_6]|uniref:hypothetical protein n=1 Tax=Stieleria tagensis TaxID=2956795 RepID=UPI00209B7F9D|nr:hypothetical protein [Stieleria tagensis]MCO8124365.1 hypothetical protein [Stieleria tagensis]
MARKSNVRFHPAADLSVIHASFVVATGGVCNDSKTEAALVQPTSEINTRLVSAQADVRTFWSGLFAAVAAGRSARDACEPALLAAGCSELQVDQTAAALASRMDECRIAFQQRFPKLGDQLQLRAGPLKDRWQTFGPGLLIETARLIWASSPPEKWWPPAIDCLLVQPLRGGDGGFDSGQNRVWIEAMLTDADPQVGEIFRLVFWITQVAVGRHLDATLGNTVTVSQPDALPVEGFGSGTHRRTSLPWHLGCVPLVLSAGAELDLIRSPKLPIATAVKLWRLGDDAVAEVVAGWWDQWSGAGAAMPVALKALDRMLAPLRERSEDSSAIDADDFADSELDR